ncbi:hypothetical protein Tco_0678050 [Tanacetum coccineum]|uniref:DUF4283 domain-containing protein n=1 Tax=Tanacetum coccineum TaxID=301880 RepID=A0ABQ4XE50_9ASTR
MMKYDGVKSILKKLNAPINKSGLGLKVTNIEGNLRIPILGANRDTIADTSEMVPVVSKMPHFNKGMTNVLETVGLISSKNPNSGLDNEDNNATMVQAVKHKYKNSLVGFFVGKKVAFPLVKNYVTNTWAKFGFEKLMSDDDGVFYFKFSSLAGWNRVPVWVKLNKVPVVAYSEDGLSLIATQIGNPIMLDAFTSSMCVEEQGQIGYARALIEVCADKELKQEVIMAVPNVEDEGVSHTLENIRVEYEWKPPLCLDCHVFGHANKQCLKRVQEQPSHTVEADDDRFTHVPIKTATKDHKPGVTKATNEEQDNGIKLKNLFENLNEITVPLTCESSGENDMEDILGVNTKANHDEVLGTGDPVHVKTTNLNKATKADLEDVLNDDDEKVDETYIEVNNCLIKQTKGASTPSNQVQDV